MNTPHKINVITGDRQSGRTTELMRAAVVDYTEQKTRIALSGMVRPELMSTAFYIGRNYSLTEYLKDHMREVFGEDFFKVCAFRHGSGALDTVSALLVATPDYKNVKRILLDDLPNSAMESVLRFQRNHPNISISVVLDWN